MDFIKEFKDATKVLVGICLVSYVLEFCFGNNFGWDDIKEWTLTNTLFTYPFFFANGILVGILDKWMPWTVDVKRRAFLGTMITIAVNLVVIYLVITLVVVFVHGGSADYVFTSQGKTNVVITLTIVAVITLIFYAAGFFKQVQSEKLINEALRKEKVNAELNALKAQVDPHFLFNSFNVLSGLIDEDPSRAQKFLSGLSRIYRYILENRNEDLITLEEELTFAHQYLELQKMRFEESIHLDLQVSAEDELKKLPALSLQLLLENAVKHNGFSEENPLNINIQSNGDCLVVSNNIQTRVKLAESNGVGLENIKERYRLHHVDGFKINSDEKDFTVHLPLIV